jgi:protoporphyrinogen oxidase
VTPRANAPAPRVAIVGGGMLGLGLALKLRDRGLRVTVIEGANRLGGLAAPHQVGAVTWDKFYHVTLLSDRYVRALLGEIGLGDRIQWRTTRTGFFTGGQLYSFSTSIDFLRFPPLSLIDKARLGWTILYASRIADGTPLEQIPVIDWLEKLSGKRTVERIWRPLLRAKLGENYKLASASFIWAIIARLYAARRSGLKQEMFGYVEGGYDVVLDRLREYLASRDVEVRAGMPVASVSGDSGSSTLTFADGSSETFDATVLTVPCPRVSALVPQLTPAEHARLGSVVYQGVLCPSLLLDQPLADYYVTNITDSWVPFTGVIEMTTLVDPQTFGGKSLVYLPRYLAQDDPTWARSDADIVEESIAALERMYPRFRRSHVVASQVARAREVLAVSTLDYTNRRLPPVATSVDRVYVVNSAQIVNGTLNVNETLGLAERQASVVVDAVQALRPSAVGVA